MAEKEPSAVPLYEHDALFDGPIVEMTFVVTLSIVTVPPVKYPGVQGFKMPVIPFVVTS